jgi:hypothetical protein
MLTSKPRKKKRGRQPPSYGQRNCPLCMSLLKLGPGGLRCPSAKCGWKE